MEYSQRYQRHFECHNSNLPILITSRGTVSKVRFISLRASLPACRRQGTLLHPKPCFQSPLLGAGQYKLTTYSILKTSQTTYSPYPLKKPLTFDHPFYILGTLIGVPLHYTKMTAGRIGNPVKTGSCPATVIPPEADKPGDLPVARVLRGKAKSRIPWNRPSQPVFL